MGWMSCNKMSRRHGINNIPEPVKKAGAFYGITGSPGHSVKSALQALFAGVVIPVNQVKKFLFQEMYIFLHLWYIDESYLF